MIEEYLIVHEEVLVKSTPLRDACRQFLGFIFVVVFNHLYLMSKWLFSTLSNMKIIFSYGSANISSNLPLLRCVIRGNYGTSLKFEFVITL